MMIPSSSMASNRRASSEFSVESPSNHGHMEQFQLKRRGGRKPTFSAEARRQRNRDAQAAFRERRTEYIKELEEKVKSYSNKLRSLEATRTSSADDCLMLRYKNSLLERILLHKGIDVQAELSSNLWRPFPVPTLVPAPIQAGITDRQTSLKRMSKTSESAHAVSESHQQPRPTSTLSHLSSISSSPETSEALTPPPPSVPAPPPKRAKLAKLSQPSAVSHSRTPSCKREDQRRVFSPGARAHRPNSPQRCSYPARAVLPEKQKLPDLASVTDFLDTEDNQYSLGSLDDFDFSMDYSEMAAMSMPGLSM